MRVLSAPAQTAIADGLVNRSLNTTSHRLTTADAMLDAPNAALAAADARAMPPVVSVVIPAKNAAAYIGETIHSALMQDGVSEIIVVDDGSTDRSRSIIESYAGRVTVIHQANAGRPKIWVRRGVS